MSRLQDVIQRGTRAAQPVATAVAAGTIYFVTGENVLERSSGSIWESISAAVASSASGVLSGGFALSLFNDGENIDPISIPGPAGPTGLTGLGLRGFPGIDGEDAEPILIPGLIGPQGPAGAAGGGSSVSLIRVALTELQIESGNSSPIQLLAGQGADKIIIPICLSLEFDLTVIYSNSPAWSLIYAGDATNLLASTITLAFNSAVAKKHGFADAVGTVNFINYGTFDPRNKAVQLIGSINPSGSGTVTGVANLVYAVVQTT